MPHWYLAKRFCSKNGQFACHSVRISRERNRKTLTGCQRFQHYFADLPFFPSHTLLPIPVHPRFPAHLLRLRCRFRRAVQMRRLRRITQHRQFFVATSPLSPYAKNFDRHVAGRVCYSINKNRRRGRSPVPKPRYHRPYSLHCSNLVGPTMSLLGRCAHRDGKRQ